MRLAAVLLIGLTGFGQGAAGQSAAPTNSQAGASGSPTASTPAKSEPAGAVIPAGTKVALALKQAISTKTAKEGDAVYAETTSGGCAWILGKKRRAERAFARAEALADRYDWPGALTDASLWVARCCEEAGVETPPSLSLALAQATSRT